MNYQKHFRKIVMPLAMLLMILVSMMLTRASTVVQAQEPDTLLPAPPPVTDYRFGIVQAYDAPEIAQAAGVGWTRSILEWNQIQPKRVDDWDYGYLGHSALDWKNKLGQNVPMVGLLVHTPEWASRGWNEDNLASTVPNGIDEPYDSPENLWGQFVRKAMQEYGNYINEWVIWNEPDTWNSPLCKKGAWNGSEEEYVKLLKIAYQVKQEFNQDAKMVMAATTYWHDLRPQCPRGEYHYISKVLETINKDPDAAANNGFFDAVGINLYLDPDQMYKILKGYESQLNNFGYYNKEIWLTETNVQHLTEDKNRPQHPDGGFPAYEVTLEEQGHFLVAGWAMSMAAGADRIEFYKMKDLNSNPSEEEYGSPFGLQRSDGSLRPVFWSYRTISTYLGGYESVEGGGYLDVNWTVPIATQVVVWPKEYGVRRVVVNRGDLGWTTVVWNRDPVAQMVSIPAKGNSGTALLADSFGAIGQIQAVGGYYQLNLPGRNEEDDRSGGTVYLIVEGSGANNIIERPSGYQDINGNFYALNITNPNPTTVTLFPVNPVSPAPAAEAETETETETGAEAGAEVLPEPTPEPTPEPEPLIPADLNCSIEGAAYYIIPIDTSPDLAQLDTEHPDLNLNARGYEKIDGPLGLLDYGGDADPGAPQLAGLFADGRIPTFTSLYQVYDWNWQEYRRGGLLNDPWRLASLVGMETRQGEQIKVPDREGGAIYQGVFKAVVIYASENQITLKYTRDDDVLDGYTVHIENVCVDPVLLSMYRSENAAFRTKLPALEGGQPIGVAIGHEILVAIRDKGNFMDPRSRKDWWRESGIHATNLSAIAPQAEVVPQVSTINSAASAPAEVVLQESTINSAVSVPAEVTPQEFTINSVTSPQKVVSRSSGPQYQFK